MGVDVADIRSQESVFAHMGRKWLVLYSGVVIKMDDECIKVKKSDIQVDSSV